MRRPPSNRANRGPDTTKRRGINLRRSISAGPQLVRRAAVFDRQPPTTPTNNAQVTPPQPTMPTPAIPRKTDISRSPKAGCAGSHPAKGTTMCAGQAVMPTPDGCTPPPSRPRWVTSALTTIVHGVDRKSEIVMPDYSRSFGCRSRTVAGYARRGQSAGGRAGMRTAVIDDKLRNLRGVGKANARAGA